MWQDIGVALGLVLVIEGILPAMSPATYRRAAAVLAQMPDGVLRRGGLLAMAAGALLVYLST